MAINSTTPKRDLAIIVALFVASSLFADWRHHHTATSTKQTVVATPVSAVVTCRDYKCYDAAGKYVRDDIAMTIIAPRKTK